ncbi:MAG: TonB-dependent receptor plug domain-containing protein [Bacteroidales bacterium]|jgi:outer membrane cobalamin receptor|nr:TonB-dependent receptor plug domain-containing protein [Bacteroidales bacterium]
MRNKKIYLSGRLYLLCTFLLFGYQSATIAATSAHSESKNKPDSLHLNLDQIVLQASFVKDKQSPLRVSTVDRKAIDKKAIGLTYPELVKNIPGVYATSETGSYGDARINIRGFKQENISVLLNGIPISGLVTGNMFWNNWLGLADATHSIQVQKGIGASMLSDNSVGGTINIITKTTETTPSANTGLFVTSYGQYKGFVSVNSGQSNKGWAVSAMASYAWGKGYPDATDINSWAYMLNISKQINNRHSLLLTLLGSPERHQQRSARLTAQETGQYGLAYNKNWGWYNGTARNLSENFYHKPYLTLHHFFQISHNTELTNSLYLSVGHGGGKWSETKGKRLIEYRKDGLVDWEAIVQANGTSGPAATNILTDYLAGHTQAGLKSNLTKKSGNWTYDAGIHYQYYSTWEKEKITDLLGAWYWYEDYQNNSLAGLAGRDPVKREGDYVRTYNGKIINHLTLHSSAQYKTPQWDIRMGASLMGSANQRWDRYNYINDVYSHNAYGTGYSFKGGASRKTGMATTIYANAGVYSRVPYSDVFFSSGNNNITQNVKNEKNLLAEVGLRHLFQRGSIEITAYYAYWKNKSVISNPYKQPDETTNRYMIRGLDALHTGVELTGLYNPARFISLEGFIGIGNWKWKNDVSASIYDPYSGLPVQEINVYSKGIPVGDAPQTQISLSATAKPFKNLEIGMDWTFSDRMYADFNPTDRQEQTDKSNPYKVPSYSLVNASVSWSPKIRNIKSGTTIHATIGNLLNEKYIERGRDGTGHNLDTFSGYWGIPRNASIGIRMSF